MRNRKYQLILSIIQEMEQRAPGTSWEMKVDSTTVTAYHCDARKMANVIPTQKYGTPNYMYSYVHFRNL